MVAVFCAVVLRARPGDPVVRARRRQRVARLHLVCRGVQAGHGEHGAATEAGALADCAGARSVRLSGPLKFWNVTLNAFAASLTEPLTAT